MIARVLGVALMTAGAAAVTPAKLASPQWQELRGEGFVLRGPLSIGTLTKVACDLDTAIYALGPPHKPAPVTVIAVSDSPGVREFLPKIKGRRQANPVGAFWRGLYGSHIVVRVDAPPEERRRRVFHEYGHYVNHSAHSEPPTWLDEGLAEIWEYAAIVAGNIELGKPVKEHLDRLRSGKNWIPIRDLTAADSILAGRAAAMFYAQSWALVHYLMFEASHGAVIDRLASPAGFPTDETLKAYVLGPMAKRMSRAAATSARADCSVPRPVRREAHLESLIARAQALADGERPEAAISLLHEALRLAPGNVDALEAMGFVHFSTNRAGAAAAIFDRLIAAGLATHISYYYRAMLAVVVPQKSNGEGPIPEVAYLRKALALSPDFPPAVARLKEFRERN